MAEPAACQGEYRSSQGWNQSRTLDPHQQKMLRDFLYGVGAVVSGVFCITVSPPLGGKFGVPLILTGCKCMYDSVSAMIEDHDKRIERIAELDKIARNAISVLEGSR